MIIKPMLAAKLDMSDLSHIVYPILGTPKIDGIRCIKVDGQALSRNFKLIPNRYVRHCVEEDCLDGFDGELVVVGSDFNSTQSGIMTFAGEPNFKYIVFDYVKTSCSRPYVDRIDDLMAVIGAPGFVDKLIPEIIKNEEELLAFEQKCHETGHEGAMFRSYDGPYKCGRSTLNEFYLVKVKRYLDSEAVVLGVEELFRNYNEAEISPTGHTVRSKSMAGLEPGGTMGRVKVKDLYSDAIFYIGSGFNDYERAKVWNNPDNYIGKRLTYKYMKYGMKDNPRHPIFLRWRLPE